MVFLFIVFFVIIFLFCCPFRVRIFSIIDKTAKNSTFIFSLFGMSRYFPKITKNSLLSINKNKTFFTKLFTENVTVSSDRILHNIGRISIDKISIQLCFPETVNYAIVYPVYGFISAIKSVTENRPIIKISSAFSHSFYLQAELSFRLNLHLIFSVFLQILKPKRDFLWK